LPLLPCSRPPAAPSMSAASWGRPRPTSTSWRARGGHGGRHPTNVKLRNQTLASRRHGVWGVVAYLRVEKPRFLFLKGSAGVVAAADVATAAPPVTSMARAYASAACVASLMGHLAAGAPVPALGAVSSTASMALGEGGAGSYPLGRARPPSLSSSFSSDDEYSEVTGEESLCCSRSRNSSLLCSRRSRRRICRCFRPATYYGEYPK
jgi:hypothetical protein